jgi:hypothetical protein
MTVIAKISKDYSLQKATLTKYDLFVLGNKNQEENQLMTTNALGQGQNVSN